MSSDWPLDKWEWNCVCHIWLNRKCQSEFSERHVRYNVMVGALRHSLQSYHYTHALHFLILNFNSGSFNRFMFKGAFILTLREHKGLWIHCHIILSQLQGSLGNVYIDCDTRCTSTSTHGTCRTFCLHLSLNHNGVHALSKLTKSLKMHQP